MQKERRKNSTSTFYVIWEEEDEEKAYTKWHTSNYTQTGKESPTAIRNS